MARLFAQYLAIYNYENFPNSIKHWPKRFNTEFPLKIAKYYYKQPKWWRNFAKSGHTGGGDFKIF